MRTTCRNGSYCGKSKNSVSGVTAKLLLLVCTILVLWGAPALADINSTVSQGYTMINMSTPDSWSYLKNVMYNPITASLLGGFAPCEGNMNIVYSDRGDQQMLLFKFTSSVTGNSVTYVVADVNKFLSTLKKTVASKDTAKPGILCHEGVDMSDDSRSNYVLRFLDNGDFMMELDRSEIGIMLILTDNMIDGLIALSEEI